jgi:IMP dehydrogenase/GMP reductase
VNKKSEEFFIKYLKTLPNSHIKQFYNDVEWTPYPVLVIKEFQRRFKPKDAEFLDKLVESVDDAKKKGQKIGKLAKIRGIKLSQRVKSRAKKTVSKKIAKAKQLVRSSDDNVELIKKLGELKKSGIITNKEFQSKKKQLLDKI